MKHDKLLAIVTPVYNRVELMERLYQSLINQDCQSFVWYIVDDGSSDDIEGFANEKISENRISIIYKRKVNGGKHTAINLAMEIVKEKYFTIVDNDDKVRVDFTSRILKEFSGLDNRNDICGIGFLKAKFNGQPIGVSYYPDRSIDTFVNMRYNKNTHGDKCEVFYTDVIKKFPFPVFEGEKFISEAVVWAKISGEYKMLFVNEALYLAEYQEGGLSGQIKKLIAENPHGASECYKQLSTRQFRLKLRAKYTIAYIACSLLAKKKKIIKSASSKALCFFLFLFGAIYKRKMKKYLS